MAIHEFEMELTPFSHMRLYGDEKYSLQNMVLKMTDYPAKLDTAKDQHFNIYVDRAYTEWHAAARLITSTMRRSQKSFGCSMWYYLSGA